MIFRRFKAHIQQENWFSLSFDFIIVVVGVFIGIQAANWNESTNNNHLKQDYLQRLSSDLESTIENLSKQKSDSIEFNELTLAFVNQINQQDTEEDELLLATAEAFFGRGVYLPNFKVNSGTYSDLRTSGNLNLLDNLDLISQLIQLHVDYAGHQEDYLINNDWILPIESKVAEVFEYLRYDRLTSHLFPVKSNNELVGDIRAHEILIRNQAALHIWLKSKLVEDYDDAIKKTQHLLNLINAELEQQ